MSDANKYRDLSRYRKSQSSSNDINLGSNRFSRSNSVNSFNENKNVVSPLVEEHIETPQEKLHKRLKNNAKEQSHKTYSSKKDNKKDSESFNEENLSYKTAQYSRYTGQKYSHRRIKKKKNAKKRKYLFRSLVGLFVLILLGIVGYKLYPITVYVNDQNITLTYNKTMQEAINSSGAKAKPGNFIAVDNSIIREGEGYQYHAELNNQETTDLNLKVRNGDQIIYTDGDDRMEDYNAKNDNIVAKSTITGSGSIHKFIGTGEPGVWSKMTGLVSKKYAEKQTKDPSDLTVRNYNVNTGSDKVVALTFDDGPSDEYTQPILDLLKKYDAKATFFVVGERLEEAWGKKLVAAEDAAGHQVCTHTYDHARSAGGVDITAMNADKQVEEVTKGQLMISEALGKSCSKVCRLPGGNITATTARLLGKYIEAEIGWNIDTGDWQKPGKDKVLKAMKQAEPGDIILCHDGGGNREDTLNALKEFLKDFSEKGYKFITIDQLMEYEEAEQKDDSKSSSSSSPSRYYN